MPNSSILKYLESFTLESKLESFTFLKIDNNDHISLIVNLGVVHLHLKEMSVKT